MFLDLCVLADFFWEFINQNFVSNMVGGLLVGVVLFYFTKKRDEKIKNALLHDKKLNFINDLKDELKFNLDLARFIITNLEEHIQNNRTSLNDYNYVIIQRILDDNSISDFPYTELKALLRDLKLCNNFLAQNRLQSKPYNKEQLAYVSQNVIDKINSLSVKIGQLN